MQLTSLNDNAVKWVRALRSGLFQQGQRYLNQGESIVTETGSEIVQHNFCCLGVACELAILDGVSVPKKSSVAVVEYDYSTGLPPRNVVDYLGLSDPEGTFNDGIEIDTPTGKRYVNTLVELNDNGYTFDQIADLIESNPDGLFRRQ